MWKGKQKAIRSRCLSAGSRARLKAVVHNSWLTVIKSTQSLESYDLGLNPGLHIWSMALSKKLNCLILSYVIC